MTPRLPPECSVQTPAAGNAGGERAGLPEAPTKTESLSEFPLHAVGACDGGVCPERDHIELEVSPRLAGISDRGLKRVRNEDDLAAAEARGPVFVAVVCDGVSDSQRADEAARAAAPAARDALLAAWSSAPAAPCARETFDWEKAMAAAIVQARAAVEALPYSKDSNQDSPETTMVAAIVLPGETPEAVVGWLGDSRAYFIGSQAALLLTHDHSWFNEVVDSGKMTRAQALLEKKAQSVTRTLGGPPGATGQRPDAPSIIRAHLPGPGWLILCTDGLWNYACEPQALADWIRGIAAPDALSLARRLVNTARTRGGRDNVTALVVRAE